ncbi:MAG: hypothetical protein RIF34_01560, partial [Candidatus Kapaibacterium sp.]
FYHNDLPGQYSIPLFTLWAYGVFHLALGIKHGFQKDFRYLGISILITILVLFPTLKSLWSYYNVFMNSIAIILALVILLRTDINKWQKSILAGFVVLNVFFISIPSDRMYNYFQMNTEKTIWRDLTWEDFKIDSSDDETWDASIYSTIDAKLNYAFNYPPAIVIGYMLPYESSKKTEDHIDDFLLKHEQGHFDLTEIFKRELQDTLRSLWGHKPSDLQKAVELKQLELKKEQELYDWATEHGTNQKYQEMLNKYYDEKLRKR